MDNLPYAVIIPAAGESSRYKSLTDGPKGLIEFSWHGKRQTMIDHVLESCPNTRVTNIVCRDSDFDAFCKNIESRKNILSLETSKGQAHSAAIGVAALKDELPILIVNCDNGFSNNGKPYDLGNFVNYLATPPASVSGAVVFPSNDPQFGYVERDGYFDIARERIVLSNWALAGAFYWHCKQCFIRSYEIARYKSGNEAFPISSMFSFPSYAYKIDRENLHIWGTSEDLLSDKTVTL